MKSLRQSLRLVRIICSKEVMDHLRDRRSVILSLVFPLMAPLIIASLMMVLAGQKPSDAKSQVVLRLPVVGSENAPEFVQWAKGRGATVIDVKLDNERPEALIRGGRFRYLVVIRDGNGVSADPVKLDVFLDRTQPRSLVAASNAMALITEYSKVMTRDALIARQVDPDIMTPIVVRERNIGRAPDIGQMFYNMVPSLLIFMIFMGAVYVAIDITVGERERGALEPLLTAPVDRGLVLFAKTLTAMMFSCGIVSVNLTAFFFALNWVHANAPNLTAPPDGAAFFKMFLIALPLVVMAVTIQMFIAMLTRSAKEAQIYLGLLPILPMIPGLMLMFTPNAPSVANASLPIYGHLLVFLAVMRGDEVPLAVILLASAGCMAFAGVIFALASSLFQRERMVFGS